MFGMAPNKVEVNQCYCIGPQMVHGELQSACPCAMRKSAQEFKPTTGSAHIGSGSGNRVKTV